MLIMCEFFHNEVSLKVSRLAAVEYRPDVDKVKLMTMCAWVEPHLVILTGL